MLTVSDLSRVVDEFYRRATNTYFTVPPGDRIAYHYTNASSLISILRNKEVWLSNVRFMNDTSELRYAVDLLRTTSSSKVYPDPVIASAVKEHISKHMIPKLNERTSRQFVLSFSLDPDSLHLWNYYGKNDGYALAVNIEELMANVADHSVCLKDGDDYTFSRYSFMHGKVLYAPDLQSQFTSEAIDTLMTLIQVGTTLRRDPDLRTYANALTSFAFILYAALYNMKSKLHEVENEYRIVVIPDSDYSNVSFRDRQGLIVPYIQMGKVAKQIKKIVIGPKIHDSSATDGLHSCLEHGGFHHVAVEMSKLEIR